MQHDGESATQADEVRRYFPEWADRPASSGPLFEAEHNSYLAGGYSEEFGYGARTDRPPIYPLLRGDPESSRLWHVQIDCLHPGYPECPRPHDLDGIHADLGTQRMQDERARTGASAAYRRRAGNTGHEPVQAFRVIRVGSVSRLPARDVPQSHRLPTLFARLWQRRHLRHPHAGH